MQLTDTLSAIRPCRESETGWTQKAERLAVNQSSLELNERGPALKVFWPRDNSGWAQSGCPRALANAGACGYRTVDQENRAGGSRAGDVRSAPFGSKIGQAKTSTQDVLDPDG